MEIFKPYLSGIENEAQRGKIREVLTWVCDTFPELDSKIAWNQPCLSIMELLL